MTSKQTKKKEVHRINSAHSSDKSKDQYSFGSNTQASSVEQRKRKFPIWPEWNEADINAEKWDAGKGGKDKEKIGKSPTFHFFEDPEGKIELPPSLKIYSWKRPQDFLVNRVPVVVKNEILFDLFSVNEHLLCSELMRWIISEIYAVWKIFNGDALNNYFKGNTGEPPLLFWKPWEHIYSLCKAVKGHMPLFNSYGKYVVKLYWMGCWRKITIDDFLPFDEENKLLLPSSTYDLELWPMLLSKAIIKLANVDIHVAERRELGEFTVIHALTGWLPEVISFHPGCKDELWELLKEMLPEFKLSEESSSESKVTEVDSKLKEPGKEVKDSKEVKDNKEMKDGKEMREGKEYKREGSITTLKSLDKFSKDKADAKDVGKKRSKNGEKEKEKFKWSIHGSRPSSDVQYSQQSLSDCSSAIQPPHMVVYATFTPLYLFEKKIFSLEEMTTSAEKLREYGLSHICSHPVLVTRTRSCPLIAPPKPPPVPPWKLFRQKRETVITDEPQEIIIKKPEQFLEISSPFLNYRMTPLIIPTETHFVQSLIKKGMPLGSGLSPLTENDETEDFSQPDLSQVTGTISQGNVASQILQGKDELLDFVLNDSTLPFEGLGLERDLLSVTTATLDRSQEEFTAMNNNVSKEIWLDFEDFCVCFQNICIFHKPSSYCINFQKTEFKFSDERVPYYLFVDSLKPIELLVCFSALVRWGESGALTKGSPPVEPGLLTVETFSWKSLKPRDLVLKIHTYATKAAMVRLPVGRHLLLLTAYAPVGHSLHVYGMVAFVVGDEDAVLPNFEPESYRFIEQSLLILKAVGNVIANFKDKEKLSAALKDLQTAHYPVPLYNKELTAQHFKVFHLSLWRLMKKTQITKPPSSFKFAFRAMTLELDVLDSSTSEDATSEWVDVKYCVPVCDEEEITAAAVKIQAMWRGAYVRLLMKARTPDTKENISVADTFQKVWAILEINMEQYAVSLLRLMFKSKCKSMESYPCYQDEETKIAFADYTVTYADQPPNSWFIVFREIFLFHQDMILVPKVYTTLPVCMLHVVNNDTMELVPKVFQKVVPYYYTKNKKGYTFVAEAYTGDSYVPSSRWKLRLIGSYNPLPSLSRDFPSNAFAMKEIRDYYIPNDKKILFRYSVKVALQHPVTIQVRTSKPDVFVKLQVLENEEIAMSSIGKGQALIPAFYFLGNEKSLSSQSSKQILSIHAPTKKEQESYAKKKSVQGSQKSNKGRPGSALVDSGQLILEEETAAAPVEENTSTPQQVYKYIVQCLVLYNSWPLTESQQMFVQALKDLEKSDNKAHGEKHEESVSSGSPDSHAVSEGPKSSGTSKTVRKGKEKSSEKEKSAKDRQAPRFEPQMSAVHSQQDDPNKPSWILRLVTEYNEADFLEVKKDTERADEIRAMKQAWEMAEPGRAIKASQARLHYLSRFIKKTPDAQSMLVPASDNQLRAEEEESSASSTKLPERKSSRNLDNKELKLSGSMLWKKWQMTKVIKELEKSVSSENRGAPEGKEEHEQTSQKENIRPRSRSPAILEMSPRLIRKALECVDVAQYVRKTNTDPLLQTDELNHQQAMQKAEEVHQFRQYRTRVLSIRDIDQEERLKVQDKVLDMYAGMRDSLDEARQKIFTLREEYRNKLLEAERLRLEALAAEEEAPRLEPEKKISPPDKDKKKKEKKK
ncbi:androglobin isoform 2-T2 [Glossophaga mutica]